MIGEIQIWSEIGQYKGIVNFIVCVYANYQFIQFSSVQLLSRVRLFVTP